MKFFSRSNKPKNRDPGEPFIYLEVDPRKAYIEAYLERQMEEMNAQEAEAQAAAKRQKSYNYNPSFIDGILNFNDIFVARFYTQRFVNYEDGSSGGLTAAKHHIWSVNKHKGEVECHETGFFQSFKLRDAFFEIIQSPFGGKSMVFGVNFKRSILLTHPENDILQDWFHLLTAIRDSISTDSNFLLPLPSYQSQQPQNMQQVSQMEESFVSISELEESPMTERPYFMFLKKDQDLTVRRSNDQIMEVKIKDVDHKSKTICVYWIENEICYEETVEFKQVCNNIPFVTSPSMDTPIDDLLI